MSEPTEAELRRQHVELLARGNVTPGPWVARAELVTIDSPCGGAFWVLADATRGPFSGAADFGLAVEVPDAEVNAQHLALCSPERIAALYQRVEELEAERASLVDWLRREREVARRSYQREHRQTDRAHQDALTDVLERLGGDS